MKLTTTSIEGISLPAGKSEHFVWDDALKGFGVRLRAGGKKTFVIQYRLGTKQRRVTVGTVGTLTLEEARKQARRNLAEVQLGADPQAAKSLARAEAAVTIGAVIKQYLTTYAAQKQRPKSFRETDRYLKRHWSPLHAFPLRKLKRADVATVLNRIASENGTFAANRARAALSAMFSWAIAQGLTDSNPVTGTRPAGRETQRTRVLSDTELKHIWSCSGDGDFGDIVKLLILTGQRRDEVAGMLWSDIDMDARVWVIPADRAKNGVEHKVPLSETALAILQKRERIADRDLVFGRKGPFSGWSKAKAALDGRLKTASANQIIKEWRLHDIRRSVATRLGDLGIQPHVTEAILNHISGHKKGVAGIYNRSTYEAEKRRALELWVSQVEKFTAVKQ